MLLRTRFSLLLTIFTAVVLSACGGGGGGGGDGGSSNPPPGNPPPANDPPYGMTTTPVSPSLNFPISSGGGSGSIRLTQVASGFSAPVFFAAIPGASGYVVMEQGGTIRLLSSTFSVQSTLLDIADRVVFNGEQGLLGLAFDPNIASNGYIYVNYISAKTGGRCSSAANSTCTRITRFQLPGNGSGGFNWAPINTGTEQVLLEVSQPAENHNGGMLAFGPDNYLYVALGDGGGGNDQFGNGQNPATLLGKILRIIPSVPATVPADNPFVGVSGWRGEIWAYGLRNPWRFSFDSQNGDLWAGDVGQNAWEEIDLITRGGNYGWPLREGSHAYIGTPVSGLIDPVVEYDRNAGRSITGGYVYRGSAQPGLRGRYFYGDFATGNIWSLNAATRGDNIQVYSGGINISSFGEDNSGELYVVDYSGGIYRIEENSPGAGSAPPALLSATGLFSNLATLAVVDGLTEYDINTPLWSDNTVKRRWFALPNNGRITFAATDAWELPVGSVFVKHFAIAPDQRVPATLRNLETRVLVHESAGWVGYTYRWRSNQSDADLISGAQSETLSIINTAGATTTQQYDYPSSAQCLSCHTNVAGVLLGPRTRQMNRNFTYGSVTDNQLRSYNHVSLFAADIGAATQYLSSSALGDGTASVAKRARDYLDANCAQCHQPGGPTPRTLDLRYSVAASAMNAIDVAPVGGSLGIADARIIAPGSKERSVLWERMRRLDSSRMPPLASHVVDQAAVDLIGQWIDSL